MKKQLFLKINLAILSAGFFPQIQAMQLNPNTEQASEIRENPCTAIVKSSEIQPNPNTDETIDDAKKIIEEDPVSKLILKVEPTSPENAGKTEKIIH